jgi:hypothetical protein
LGHPHDANRYAANAFRAGKDDGNARRKPEYAFRETSKRIQPHFCFDSCGSKSEKPPMPKKPGTNPKGEFAFFNVVYEDGSQRSNRRVPTELLGGLEGDEPARGFIMEQDRDIAEKSGRPVLQIKSIERVGARKKKVD